MGMLFPKDEVCCFSGHRPEKFQLDTFGGSGRFMDALEAAVRRAAKAGCKAFLSGMSRGFDLWAAAMVLQLREELGVQLWCAVPFPGQENHWPEDWKALYQEVLLSANRVFCLADRYSKDCYYERNRFMVCASGRLICCYIGQPGGTAFTVRFAREQGLVIDNIADPQLALWEQDGMGGG